MDHELFKKYYTKNPAERIDILKQANLISAEDKSNLLNSNSNLENSLGNYMIENYVGDYALPMGVATNFTINGKDYVLPMVTEEPSVIAAASNAGKVIGQNGGFQTSSTERLMTGQVALYDIPDVETARKNLSENRENILKLADQAYPSIVNRGGGARDLEVREISEDGINFLIVHLYIDTKEAMGANMINTMMEGISDYLIELTGGRALMQILSNLSDRALFTAKVSIAPETLAKGDISGEEVVDQIVKAGELAWVDPYRATTNNKGIMNGINALVLATGNDTRAVESASHAYASRDGKYRSLTKWTKDSTGNLNGEITVPVPVGTVGGTISIHDGAKIAHKILGNPSAVELGQIIAAVGLGQNFSAIRALVTEGIQKGHMSLQARSLAINAGANNSEVHLLTEQLKHAEKMNLATAKELLEQMRGDE